MPQDFKMADEPMEEAFAPSSISDQQFDNEPVVIIMSNEEEAMPTSPLADHLPDDSEKETMPTSLLADHLPDDGEKETMPTSLLADHLPDDGEKETMPTSPLADHLPIDSMIVEDDAMSRSTPDHQLSNDTMVTTSYKQEVTPPPTGDDKPTSDTTNRYVQVLCSIITTYITLLYKS